MAGTLAFRSFTGPKSLKESLSRSKSIAETIDGNPTTRADWAAAAPPTEGK